MNRNELINKTIAESGMSVKAITEACNAADKDLYMEDSYLRMFKNNSKRNPDYKYLRAIAKACGKHEDLFVLQDYFDKAPEAFHTLINDLREIAFMVPRAFLEMKNLDGVAQEKAETYFDMSEAEFLLEYIEEQQKTIRMPIDVPEATDIIKAFLGTLAINDFEVADDSMSPLIPKGSTVSIIQTEYTDDDILYYMRLSDHTVHISLTMFLDETHTRVKMSPINRDYTSETFDMQDIRILGKATQYTKKL